MSLVGDSGHVSSWLSPQLYFSPKFIKWLHSLWIKTANFTLIAEWLDSRIRSGYRILHSNVSGLCGNIRDFSVASPTYDAPLCSETHVIDWRRMSVPQIDNFENTVLKLRDLFRESRWLVVYARDNFLISKKNYFKCYCFVMLILRICGSTCNFDLFSLSLSPSGDDGFLIAW